MHKEEAGVLFKALGDPTRVKIIKMLYHRNEICACKFLDIVDCGQSTLSHHLSVLASHDLVRSRKDGNKVLYSCNKELIDQLMSFIQTPCGCVKEN